MSDFSLGLSTRDREKYSLSRALLANAMPQMAHADYELECSRSLETKTGTVAKGIYIPDDIFTGRRSLEAGSGAGANVVATDLLAADFIEMLRPEARVLQLGATVLSGLVGNIAVPRQTGTITAQWLAEQGSITATDATFDQVTLNPKTLAAQTSYSRQLLAQSTPAVDGIVRTDILRAFGVAIDSAAINGTGTSNQPTGILQTSGIGSVAIGTNGGAPTWASILSLIDQLASANALRGKLGFLTNSSVSSKLMGTPKIGTTFPAYLLDAPYNTLAGYPFAISNNVPDSGTKGTGTDLSTMIFANWEDLVIDRWGAPIDIVTDPYTGAGTGVVKVAAFSLVDIGVRHAESFAACTDLVTS